MEPPVTPALPTNPTGGEIPVECSQIVRFAQLDDLLQLSRVTRTEMQSTRVDLSALAQTIAARLQSAQPGRQVELVIQPGLEATGDARLLEIVLTNLFSNAWKFTGPRPAARIEFGRIEFSDKFAQVWDFGDTGSALCLPELQHHHLAAQ